MKGLEITFEDKHPSCNNCNFSQIFLIKMNRYVMFASIVILIHCGYSIPLGIPQFQIRDGNCSVIPSKDIVFKKTIQLTAIPLIVREDKVSFENYQFFTAYIGVFYCLF